jgi:hypothetical protein
MGKAQARETTYEWNGDGGSCSPSKRSRHADLSTSCEVQHAPGPDQEVHTIGATATGRALPWTDADAVRYSNSARPAGN